jgi:hypothetical protein
MAADTVAPRPRKAEAEKIIGVFVILGLSEASCNSYDRDLQRQRCKFIQRHG